MIENIPQDMPNMVRMLRSLLLKSVRMAWLNKDKRIFYSWMLKLSWNETLLHVVLVDLDDYLVTVIQSGNHLGQGSVAEADFYRNFAHQGFLGGVI